MYMCVCMRVCVTTRLSQINSVKSQPARSQSGAVLTWELRSVASLLQFQGEGTFFSKQRRVFSCSGKSPTQLPKDVCLHFIHVTRLDPAAALQCLDDKVS